MTATATITDPATDTEIDLDAEIERGRPAAKNTDQLYLWIPGDSAFDGQDFLRAADLQSLAASLIQREGDLSHLVNRTVVCLWRRKGGTPGNKPAVCGTTKAAGVLAFFANGTDWIVWLAADHLREARATHRHVEAALLHCLLHCGETDKGKPSTAPHDFEGFSLEYVRYGAWRRELVLAVEAIRGAERDGQQLSFAQALDVDDLGDDESEVD